MGEPKRVTTYVASNVPPSRPPSIISLNNDFSPLNPRKPGQLLRGPRRVVRLCVFALLVPAALVTVPLYVRLVLYPPASYPMMPTDQRLLSRHVSSFWCQAQTTHMNGSFNGYLSRGVLGIQSQRRNHLMLHHLQLQDDIKEYWGFYLLKGSTITISSCAKWDGAQLMILRGIENLRRCAWIGERDSREDMAEDDDEESNERHRQEEEERRNAGPRILSPRPDELEFDEGIRTRYSLGNKGGGKVLETDTSREGRRGDTVNGEPDARRKERVTHPPRQTLEEAGGHGEEEQGSLGDDSTTAAEGDIHLDIANSEERRRSITDLLRQAIRMSKSKKEILRILHSEGHSQNGASKKRQFQSSPKRKVTAVLTEPRQVQQSLQKESDGKVTVDESSADNTGYSNADEIRNTETFETFETESKGRNRTETNLTNTDSVSSKVTKSTVQLESMVNRTEVDADTKELAANSDTMADTDSTRATPDAPDRKEGVDRARKSRKLKDEIRRGRVRKQNSRGKKGSRREKNLTEEDLSVRARQRRHLHLEYEYEEVSRDGAFEVLDAEDVIGIMSEAEAEGKLTDQHKQTDNNKPLVENSVGGRIFFPEGLKFERGKFNQTTANDNSREEHVSSYSSSEEALASCEGVIMTLPLVPFRGCSFYSGLRINRIVYDIPVTGTYYFVFSSDNEIYVNDLYFNLTMERVVYNVTRENELCTNTTDCTMPLRLWSSQYTVVDVPQESGWENAYVLNTKCEPRVYVYLTLLLLVPLLIMCCAFH